jgi:hypothetical protein
MFHAMDLVHWICFVGGILLAASVPKKAEKSVPGIIIMIIGIGIGVYGAYPIGHYFIH